MKLLEPLVLRGRTARNRIVFGPHETNLGRSRSVSDRHVAYYRRRAVGGAGIVVIEEASVHPSDWPYERCPSATASVDGWRAVAGACRAEGALVLAALGHSGGQGSSAYSQAPLWAPSRVPEVNTREVPKWMEPADVRAVVDGFGEAARLAARAGVDGVEVNAGQHSLIRQFLSGLTNHRTDEWGQDKLRFACEVLTAVRRGAGDEVIVGLRLSCDELAPWAGITPDTAVEVALGLADLVDYVTVVRGSIYTVSATRPDCHTEPGFNVDLARAVTDAVGGRVAVIAQGSIVDPAMAEEAVAAGVCVAVEMTRAQIADPDLARKVAAGEAHLVRPCILCNQACQVRDARNPIVSCVVEPSSGHEWEDPPLDGTAVSPADVFVVGGGVAGLETARVAASRGHRVTLAEATDHLGGMVRVASRGAGRDRLALAADWLESECDRLGVKVETAREVTAEELDGVAGEVVLCTGSRAGRRTYEVDGGAAVLSAAEALADIAALPEGPVVVWDPIGGPIGISVVEALRALGRDVHLVTPDLIAGNELSRTGDLAPANVRLQAAGARLERRSLLRRVRTGAVDVEDRFTGASRTIGAAVTIDAGYRLPDDALWRASGEHLPRAGDAVAPRTIHEAVLEARRRVLELETRA
ncbi:MAG: mycofactocin system FadH/OYE family oxidoreductase 1 [Actinobacteria bacterium]|nr:mycofactocin system FadH/OYE family oxidoreductase 1 [Actinomycetota bacterium]